MYFTGNTPVITSIQYGNMEFKGILTLSLFQMEMELYLERKRIQCA